MNPYFKTNRRILIDMHIPDWDKDFLKKFDVSKVVDMYKLANVDAVMFYAQSCIGHCFYPPKIGEQHKNLVGRDIVSEMLLKLRENNIASSIYYSVVFNNLAYLENPDWRIVSRYDLTHNETFSGSKYALCCPNNPGYKEFSLEQTREITKNYDFDCFFFDMAFWRPICVCEYCKARYKSETRNECLPEVLNWLDPRWCEYQKIRENWTLEYMNELSNAVKVLKPNMAVYHNAGGLVQDWRMATPLDISDANDFLGGDFYGGNAEQCFVGKLFRKLSKNKMEVMVPVCTHIKEHEMIKPIKQIEQEALRAFSFGGASLFIHAINPNGTLNKAPYSKIKNAFSKIKNYEEYISGTLVEDVAIYFSSESKMNFADNNKSPDDAANSNSASDVPHIKALLGACDKLQHYHIPFSIITKKDLSNISKYKLLILANISRITQDEVQAFKKYVKNGAAIYASSYTSLTEVNGTRHNDFMMADMFACHFDRENIVSHNYIKPTSHYFTKVMQGQRYCTYSSSDKTLVYLKENVEGKVLAKLTKPYSEKEATVDSNNWSSIHTSPPWNDTEIPMIVENNYGKGKVIYSCADIENADSELHRKLFKKLIKKLFKKSFSFESKSHPCIIFNVFHQAEKERYIVTVLNNQINLPLIYIKNIYFTIALKNNEKIKSAILLKNGKELKYKQKKENRIKVKLDKLKIFAMINIKYCNV